MRKWVLLGMLCLCGCGAPPATTTGIADPVAPEIYRRWQQDDSYYALVEIIDAHLDRPDHCRATRRDVLRRLGQPNWDTICIDRERVWCYQGSGRHVPRQDKVLFTFDDRDKLVDIQWVSE